MELKHDKRLDKLTNGGFVMWNDTHNQMIPVGESISQPLMPEKVRCRLKVYGPVILGHMGLPWVDFLNTDVDMERFDRYKLAIWREYTPIDPEHPGLPFDNPDIDYHYDLGLKTLWADVALTVSVVDSQATGGRFIGEYSGKVFFRWTDAQTWTSELLHFANFDLQELYGDFFLVSNPTAFQSAMGQAFSTGEFLQEVNLPVTAIVQRATIKNGNSEARLLLQNSPYNVEITAFSMGLIGGE